MGTCALYDGCALPAPVGSTLVGSWLPDAKQPTSTNQFTDECNPWEVNWGDGPLYRPSDYLAMVGGGLEKLMRMSTRHM
jgi:hypothetical protein